MTHSGKKLPENATIVDDGSGTLKLLDLLLRDRRNRFDREVPFSNLFEELVIFH